MPLDALSTSAFCFALGRLVWCRNCKCEINPNNRQNPWIILDKIHMGLIDDELSEVKKLCERRIDGSKLVACVPSMIRVEIKRTDFKHFIVCMQFPQDYPKCGLIVELKSKTLSERLLQGLTNICDQECKKHLGKPQILPVLAFLRNFIDENPLSCCYDEISNIRKLLGDDRDEFKLKQKSSCIHLKAFNGQYYFNTKLVVPDNYPQTAVSIDNVDSNFPPSLIYHIVTQSKEIARQCVEPPLKPRKNDPPFKHAPSLEKACAFIIKALKGMPGEKCQFCKQQGLPSDPSLTENNSNSPKHVERVYCGHLYHLGCLQEYMRKPPFGNKRCQTCDQPIFSHKWSLSDKLAEDRWAHEQARERELDEVEEFFK